MDATQMRRLMELAREQAFVKHARYVLEPNTRGHVQGMNDREWGFSACPHPDCAALRAGAEAGPLPPQPDLNALIALMADIRHCRDEWQGDPAVSDDQAIAADVWARELEAILKPYEVAGPLPAWQPIATAPKDGTPVLVYGPGKRLGNNDGTGAIYVCWWNSGWTFFEKYAGPRYEFLKATHWLPLPAGPLPPATEGQ